MPLSYKLVAFDLDGTLTESKLSINQRMADKLTELSKVTKVAIISGGAFPQFASQVVAQLPADALIENLFILREFVQFWERV